MDAKPLLSPGQSVSVYRDPINRLGYEGEGKLIRFVRFCPDGCELWRLALDGGVVGYGQIVYRIVNSQI